MKAYCVTFSVDVDAENAEEAALTVLSWFGEGMMPIADVQRLSTKTNKPIGKPVSIDTEAIGIGAV